MGQLVSGANKRVMVGLEATPGTELPTPGAKAMEFLIVSETIKASEEQQDSMLLSADAEPRDPAAGKIAAAGDIKTYIQSKSFGLLAFWALGGYTPPGGSGPNYVHTITPAATERALDLDVEIPFSGGSKYKRVNNLVCNSFQFGFQAVDFVEVT
ncbi:MAG: phage tail tube protein, partial [Elusimicrobia bacterium]|nr:phage tail tube protein [Elusimicrobiota bacterium]